jgi:hypothetical protein
MPDIKIKRDHLISIDKLLFQAIRLSYEADEAVLSAHIVHAQACATERLKLLA